MDIKKTILALCIITVTATAAVQVLDPVNQSLEDGDTLDLTYRSYQSKLNIVLDIEKRNWANITSPDLDVETIEIGNTLRVSLKNTPDDKGEYTDTVVFHAEDGSQQVNTIKYRIEETPLHVYMKYPLKREINREETAHLGKVGPQQKLALIFGRKLNSGAFYWNGIKANGRESSYFNVPKDEKLQDILPSETIEEKNLSKGTYLALNIRAPRETGEFTFNATFDSGIFSLPTTREFSVNVEKDVYTFNISDLSIKAGEKHWVEGDIESDSIAPEEFTYKPVSLPKEWVRDEGGSGAYEIKVRPGENREVSLPIKINQEGQYKAIYNVTDSAGTYMGKQEAEIHVKPTLKSKLQGFGKGHSLTLPILQPFYSLLSLFGL